MSKMTNAIRTLRYITFILMVVMAIVAVIDSHAEDMMSAVVVQMLLCSVYLSTFLTMKS